ncbi:EPIDERMAL PATTERNING FACTOR-like protein 6 [Vicia villosa]|uniref:EPIDERMAL PATTERNING FACTOR-like protein 6 n=1 Tax=Vicia villosa TaxID=3911 RepID=UPI00273BF763|nr:EPIDERMAL PATTERNING FACTOR-like protein 6 [Vicia villosa]
MRSITMLMNKTHVTYVTFFMLSLILATTIASSITSRDVRRPVIFKNEIDIQHIEKTEEKFVPQTKSDKFKGLLSKKVISEIGSHPPSCVNGCDNCTPCTPTLVSGSPQEESWKCKCGDKLYDPPKK